MDNIYMLSDEVIIGQIAGKVKSTRLKQNITQQSLAEAAGVSLSSVKKIEKGEIGSFDTLLRILRTLGLLDMLQPLIEEEQLSPNEYYKLVQSTKNHERKRAAGRLNDKPKEGDETW